MDIDEDAVWGERQLGSAPVDHTTASPMFYQLLHRDRDLLGCPAPEQVVGVFEQLIIETLRRGAVWLQDWAWPDLIGMLGWDDQTVQATSQHLQRIGAAVEPRVIYLGVDPHTALLRALEERGPQWFNRHAGTPIDAPVTASVVDRLAARKRQAEPARIDALAGWPTIWIDGAAPQEDVVEAVWQELEPAVTPTHGVADADQRSQFR
jgi:hypothetical protein